MAALLAAGSALPQGSGPRPERCEGVELGANNRLDGRECRSFDGTLFTDWDENGDCVLTFDEFEDCLGPMPVTFHGLGQER